MRSQQGSVLLLVLVAVAFLSAFGIVLAWQNIQAASLGNLAVRWRSLELAARRAAVLGTGEIRQPLFEVSARTGVAETGNLQVERHQLQTQTTLPTFQFAAVTDETQQSDCRTASQSKTCNVSELLIADDVIFFGNVAVSSRLIIRPENIKSTLRMIVLGSLTVLGDIIVETPAESTIEILTAGNISIRTFQLVDDRESDLLLHACAGEIALDSLPPKKLNLRLEAFSGVIVAKNRRAGPVSEGENLRRDPAFWPATKTLAADFPLKAPLMAQATNISD